MIGVALGALAAAVPFIFSRLATGGSRESSGGMFRTHTARPSPEPTRLPFDRSPAVRRGNGTPAVTPIVTPQEPPPASMPLIDPWATQPATAPAPEPMPTPPPFALDPGLAAQYAAASRYNAEHPGQQAPLLASMPTGTRSTDFDRVQDDPRDAPPPYVTDPPSSASLPDAPPPAMPEPPPFVEPAQTPPASMPTSDDRPPQERGELPAELATLPPRTVDAPPDGYDPVKARSLAKQVASNITNRGNSYSRDLLKQFQRFAGIASEGIYGGESRGALEFFGVRRPPVALFKPTATVPYRWATWSQ